MEKTLQNVNQLIEKLKIRVESALENKEISSLEVQLILDLLKQTYLEAEQLKVHNGAHVQGVQPAINEAPQQVPASPEIEVETPAFQTYTTSPEPVILIRNDDKQIHDEEPVGIPPAMESPNIDVEPVHHEEPLIMPPAMEFPRVEVDSIHDERPFAIPPPMEFPKVEVESIHDKVPFVIPASMEFPKVEVETTSFVKTPPVQPYTPTYTPPVQTYSYEHQPQRSQPVESQAKPPAHTTDLFGNLTIADKLRKDSPSLNDRITSDRVDHSLAHQMQLKPISDLRTAIGINEKFQLVNDLFDGYTEKYNEAISGLNNCISGNEAQWMFDDLKLKHNWVESNESFNKLKSFIKRRYL